MRRILPGLLVVLVLVGGAIWTRASMTAGHHAHGAMGTIDLVGFLTLGLLGGFGHCIGMCSPFVLFVSRAYGAGRGGALAAQAYYGAGRLVTYSVLGGVAGVVGAGLESAGALLGLHRAALVVAGVALVAWAIVALSNATRVGIGGRLFTRLAGAAKHHVPGHPFVTGLLLGWLPCGLLYSAVIGAVASGGAWQGAAALALFAAGTIPALAGISLADELLVRHRALLNRLSQVFIFAMGARFLWMALSR